MVPSLSRKEEEKLKESSIIAENKKNEEIKLEEEKITIDDNFIFNNYESDFEKKSTTILEKIKKIKEIPKTRV